MDKNRSELFGQFCYDDSLTYEDLLRVEEILISDLQNLFSRATAEHIDFTPLGDALMCQCVFEEHKQYIYRKIAQEITAILPKGVTGRLLCVDKNLNGMHIYWLEAGQWQEEERNIPEVAPSGLKVWSVPQIRTEEFIEN